MHASEGSLDYTAADAASLLEAFMDDSFSSVLQMRNRADPSSPTLSTLSLSDVLASDATSEIIRQSVRRRQQSSVKEQTGHKSSVKFSPVLRESRKDMHAAERPLIQQQPQRIVRRNSHRDHRRGESWTSSLRRMVANALTIKPSRAPPRSSVGRSTTSSTSSTDSSHPSREPSPKVIKSRPEKGAKQLAPSTPMLMVTGADDNDSMQEIAELPGDHTDTYLTPETLGAGGHRG